MEKQRQYDWFAGKYLFRVSYLGSSDENVQTDYLCIVNQSPIK